MTPRTRVNFILDSVAGILFIFSLFAGDGSPFHIGVGIAFTGAAAAHVYLHWDWIARQTRSLVRSSSKRSSRTTSLNLIVDLFLLVTFAVTLLSGMALLVAREDIVATRAHGVGSALFIVGMIVHIALHRAWIMRCIRQVGEERRALHIAGASAEKKTVGYGAIKAGGDESW